MDLFKGVGNVILGTKRVSRDAASERSKRLSDDSSKLKRSVESPPSRLTTIQSVEAEMPSTEEIDTLLEDMFDQMGFKPKERENILRLPDDSKWTLLQQHSKQQPNLDPADKWASKIQHAPTAENLESLSVILRTAGVRWVEDFIVVDGVVGLCNLLELFEMKTRKSTRDFQLIQASPPPRIHRAPTAARPTPGATGDRPPPRRLAHATLIAPVCTRLPRTHRCLAFACPPFDTHPRRCAPRRTRCSACAPSPTSSWGWTPLRVATLPTWRPRS
jgi:hypothetical protein